MKGIFKAAVMTVAAVSTSSVFAAGIFSARGDTAGRTYTESSYWRTPRTDATVGTTGAPAVNGVIVNTPAQVLVSPGPTAGPWFPGDDIRNANSALWGVGG
jgi:hypothetical protein